MPRNRSGGGEPPPTAEGIVFPSEIHILNAITSADAEAKQQANQLDHAAGTAVAEWLKEQGIDPDNPRLIGKSARKPVRCEVFSFGKNTVKCRMDASLPHPDNKPTQGHPGRHRHKKVTPPQRKKTVAMGYNFIHSVAVCGISCLPPAPV